jgi:hypothetical protein
LWGLAGVWLRADCYAAAHRLEAGEACPELGVGGVEPVHVLAPEVTQLRVLPEPYINEFMSSSD